LPQFSFFGLLERDLLGYLLLYFVATCAALLILFHVFTIFEVLRGLNAPNAGVLLIRYLILLTPTVLWQIAPTALMIAVLATYSIKARQNETIIWGAAGQSIYVLLLPAIFTAAALGLIAWEWQEKVLPETNPRQDMLRAQLRGAGGVAETSEGRFWVAAPEGIYSFNAPKTNTTENTVAKNLSFYQFDSNEIHLIKSIRAQSGEWSGAHIKLSEDALQIIWRASFVEIKNLENQEIEVFEGENPFNQIATKTLNLNVAELKKQILLSESPIEQRRLSVALEKKYVVLALPLVMVFFAAPLALALHSRKGGIARSLGLAVIIWLLFNACSAFLERLGAEGLLPATVAVWSPLIAFSAIGLFFIAKTRN